MASRTRRLISVVAITLGLAVSAAAPAAAITGGEPDGDRHPNVALISFYEDGVRFRCSATLVTPTVLVTAAHCTFGTSGSTLVDFSSVVALQKPLPYPVAADPAAGFTSAEIAAAGYRSGTSHAHPQYSDFTDLDNWNDVGVVVLDAPVTGIAPAQVAPANYLEQFRQPALNHELFTSVGYGTEVRKSDSGTQKPTPQSYPLIRRYADAPGQKLTPQILQTNGNINDTRGTGGTCFGDSGGPTFKNGYIVTVTSYGYTSNCRYLDGLQRVDIKVVQDWLATYGVYPASA